MKDLYKILEVDPSASKEIIQASYKILAKKYHPDLNNNSFDSYYEEKMKELNIAKDILMDENKRANYDCQLKQEQEHEQKQKQEQEQKKKKKKIIPPIYHSDNHKIKSVNKKHIILLTIKILFSIAIIIFSIFMIVFLSKMVMKSFGIKQKKPHMHIQTTSSSILTNNFTNSFSIDNKNKKLFELKPGMDENYVMSAIGKNPDEIASAYIRYGTSKVLLNNRKVIGWIDTDKNLPIIRYNRIPNTFDIQINANTNDIIKTWGWPDTYSSQLLVYYNIFIYIQNNKVIKVEMINN